VKKYKKRHAIVAVECGSVQRLGSVLVMSHSIVNCRHGVVIIKLAV